MPGGGVGQLILVEHCARLCLCDEPYNCHAQACCCGGVRLLPERMAAGFTGSGEETVGSEPGLGDVPPADRGFAAEPIVVIGCR
jgi:hypothetical protein